MFPFKAQLFRGYKSETESINTKSVVNQALLAAYYKADTKHQVNCGYNWICE
jgi:hypothetical protein